MSNRRHTPYQSNTNCRRLADQARTIIAAILLSGGILSPGMIAWANGPAPGTVIENQATGSFVDPSDSSTKLIESNVVQVTVAEVAGIAITNNGYNEPTDGTVNEGDTVYFDFVLTNVGNDPTQFVIPGASSVTNGTQADNIQIIAYDADGTGAGAAVDLSGSNITVPGGGDTTGNLLNGVASTNNGSVPAGGSITVRVPITAGTAGLDLTVTLGDTVATDGQNEVYVPGTNDAYTQDNTGTTNGDTDGVPINNEREASDSLTVTISSSVISSPAICGIDNPPSTTDGTPSIYANNVYWFDWSTVSTIANGQTRNVNFTLPDGRNIDVEVTVTNETPGGNVGVEPIPVSGNRPLSHLLTGTDTTTTDIGGSGARSALRTNVSSHYDNDVTVSFKFSQPLSVFYADGEASGNSNSPSTADADEEHVNAITNGDPWVVIDSRNHGTGFTLQTSSGGRDLLFTALAQSNDRTAQGTPLAISRGATEFQAILDTNDGGRTGVSLGVFLPDVGDAPASYGIAAHQVNDVNCGTSVDPYLGTQEPDGEDPTEVQSASANGDNTGSGSGRFSDDSGPPVPSGPGDEDGVQLNGSLLQTQSLIPGSDITLDITTVQSGVLNAWFDWDGNGQFDSGEQVATNLMPSGGMISLSVTVPANAQLGITYARFRYGSEADLGAIGYTSDGEVEDYQVEIAAPSFDISGTLYVDSNNNDLYENGTGGSEASLPENITVRLLSSDGTTELATTVTDTNGFYSFPDLAPDTYQVAVETTDPDIPVGLDIGTTTPLTVVANSTDATDQNFGFDLMTSGSGISFCENPNGEVYSGGISNDIYGIYPPTGATFRITSSALARVVNSLATDHVNRVVYYADGQAIYAWDPINDTHVRLRDSSGNINVSSMLGGANISSLSSGGAAFYGGALYLGIEIGAFPPSNSDTEVYRVDFVPGSNGLTIQSLTVIGVNDNTGGANGSLDNADWGDMIISDTGVIYGATRFVGSGSGSLWSFDLNTSIYSLISNNYLGQLAKDGNGTLWGLSDTGRIQRVDVNTGSLFGPSSPTSTAIADMGECVVGFSTIGDRVWDDLDGDGVQDTLEPGIANVTVGLYRDLTGNGVIDGSDPLLTTQVTNASGNYDFVDLIPGTYIIRILEGTADDLDGTNVLDGSILTTTSSTPGGQQAVNLPLGLVDYDDADFGYQLPVIPQNPNVLLVKRITQINNDTVSAGGDALAGYINQDDVTNPYDDNDITVADPVNPTDPPKDTDQWPDPTTNLIGGIDGGNVMPNDEIEYTIYYLSSGDATAENVLFCDYVPTFTSYIPNGYNGSAPQATGGIGGADLSIELFRNGTTDYHTGANDGDSATYFSPGTDPATSFPDIDCDGDRDGINANPNGAVVVNLGDLPDATTDAAGAYGYVRFRARVK